MSKDRNHPQEMPTRKNPNQIDPAKDSDLEPSKNNPKNPLPDDTGIDGDMDK